MYMVRPVAVNSSRLPYSRKYGQLEAALETDLRSAERLAENGVVLSAPVEDLHVVHVAAKTE